MKWMLACFLVFIISCIPIIPNTTQVAQPNTSSTVYYFSSSIGVDTRTAIQAKNPDTPWKTISKLSSVFSLLNPGDSVLLKRGDTFTGTIRVSKSGDSTAPITIGAYGDGKKPILSGFQTLSGWEKITNNIWESKEIAWNTTPRVLIMDNIVTPICSFRVVL